jgi:hypothetical protein
VARAGGLGGCADSPRRRRGQPGGRRLVFLRPGYKPIPMGRRWPHRKGASGSPADTTAMARCTLEPENAECANVWAHTYPGCALESHFAQVVREPNTGTTSQPATQPCPQCLVAERCSLDPENVECADVWEHNDRDCALRSYFARVAPEPSNALERSLTQPCPQCECRESQENERQECLRLGLDPATCGATALAWAALGRPACAGQARRAFQCMEEAQAARNGNTSTVPSPACVGFWYHPPDATCKFASRPGIDLPHGVDFPPVDPVGACPACKAHPPSSSSGSGKTAPSESEALPPGGRAYVRARSRFTDSFDSRPHTGSVDNIVRTDSFDSRPGMDTIVPSPPSTSSTSLSSTRSLGPPPPLPRFS